MRKCVSILLEWMVRIVSTFIQMGAIVIGFYAALGIRGVDVEGIEVCAYRLYWAEVLVHDARCQLSRTSDMFKVWAIGTCPAAAPVSST